MKTPSFTSLAKLAGPLPHVSALRHPSMQGLALAAESLAEVLWPTTCALCDTPDALLCDACWRSLPFVDVHHACPICGAPWGRAACTECNHHTLTERGLDHFPLDGCACVLAADERTTRLVTIYKDKGERRLASEIASLMAPAVVPAWLPGAFLTTIACRPAALRTRGFDHMEPIRKQLARSWDVPEGSLLMRRSARDQRALDARERLRNMRGVFAMAPGVRVPRRIIVADDVMTTGATLFAAAECLRAAGAHEVFALTLLRA